MILPPRLTWQLKAGESTPRNRQTEAEIWCEKNPETIDMNPNKDPLSSRDSTEKGGCLMPSQVVPIINMESPLDQ